MILVLTPTHIGHFIKGVCSSVLCDINIFTAQILCVKLNKMLQIAAYPQNKDANSFLSIVLRKPSKTKIHFCYRHVYVRIMNMLTEFNTNNVLFLVPDMSKKCVNHVKTTHMKLE